MRLYEFSKLFISLIIFNYFIFLIATWSWIFHENFKLYTDYILFGKIVGVSEESSQVFSRILLKNRSRQSSDRATPLIFITYRSIFYSLLDLPNCNTHLTWILYKNFKWHKYADKNNLSKLYYFILKNCRRVSKDISYVFWI